MPYGWTTDWANQLYGGQSFLWQAPLTPADVNAPDFGVGYTATLARHQAAMALSSSHRSSASPSNR